MCKNGWKQLNSSTWTYFIRITNPLSVNSCMSMKSLANYGGGCQRLCKHLEQLRLPCGLGQPLLLPLQVGTTALASTWHHHTYSISICCIVDVREPASGILVSSKECDFKRVRSYVRGGGETTQKRMKKKNRLWQTPRLLKYVVRYVRNILRYVVRHIRHKIL